MVKVRIPGLDHSLLEDGRWAKSTRELPPLKLYVDPERLPAKLKLERSSAENPNQGSFW